MRTRGPGAHHEQRRVQICDAVLEVVDAAGLAGVSLTSVAAQAGVSAGRVQHYFPTRDALLEAAFDRANELATRRIAAVVGSSEAAGAPRAVLEVVLTGLIPHDGVQRTHMRVRQSFTAQALSDERIAARLREQYSELVDTLAALLGPLTESRANEVRDVAVGLLSLTEGLAYHVLTGLHSPEVARRQVLEAIEHALAG